MLVVIAAPIFLAFMLWDLWSMWRSDMRTILLRETWINIVMGLGYVAIDFATIGLLVAIYTWFYEHRVLDVPRAWWTFLIFVVASDFCYYWYHRVSHESRLWWAAHEAHHSSPQYTFGTAIRQAWTTPPHSWFFWAPLCIIGFPVEWILIEQSVSLFYQFFIHTERVGKFGWLEWIFNTPSHHRVHHGVNIQYLDKNYGGIFIIWDRIFGTYAEEVEQPRYGVMKEPPNPLPWQVATHVWADIIRDVRSAPSLGAALGYIFAPPGWRHDDTGKTARMMQAELALAKRRP